MQRIAINGFPLHSTTSKIHTIVKMPLEGLEHPSIRLDAYNNPGRGGQTIANQLPGGRLISLQGVLLHDSADNYLHYRSALIEEFALKQRVPHVLQFTTLAGNQYRVEGYIRSFIAPHERPTHNRWMLDFQATDWRLESEQLFSVNLTLPISGGFATPADTPLVFSGGSGGTVNAINAGTAPTWPEVKLFGPMQNPTIINETTNRRIGLNLNLVAGDVITINMGKFTIIQGNNTNRMGAKTSQSRFWDLQPGNNSIRLTAESFDTGSATVSYRYGYWGI